MSTGWSRSPSESIATHQARAPGAEILGVGVGAPGPLDTKSGIVLLTPNLGWVNLPLRQIIRDRLGLPAELDNDANCAVLGEWWVGAARGSRHAIGITIGTGIGGGLILDGRLYHGASDVAGEIGHTTIDTEGRRCKCGNYGCLEAYASGPNIAMRAIEGMEAGAETRLPSYVGGDTSKITAQTVYEAAHDGDELALEVVNDTAKFLGAGVSNLLNVFNPEVVVICGGVTLAGDHLFIPLRRETARRAFKPAVAACRIVPGELVGTAGVYGSGQDRSWMPKVGILGSLVWDQIYGRDPLAEPVEEWGGVAYALASLDASVAPGWEIVPLIKVGQDLAGKAHEFLGGLRNVTPGGRCVEVPAPNNRVVLHYYSTERRTERMSGGVPGWTWSELGPMVRDLDALYLNFISGFELALGTAQALRQGFRGPIYVDLHSLLARDATRRGPGRPTAPGRRQSGWAAST